MTNHGALYDQTMDCIEAYASVLVKTKRTEMLPKLQHEMEDYSSLKSKYIALEEAFKSSVSQVESAKTKQETEEVFEAFEKKMEQVEKIKKKNNDQRLEQFVKLCEPGNDDDDDDLRITQNTVNTIDPISRKRMVDPVKNKNCGHHYEKSVVLQLINQQPKTRCPIMGCTVTVILPADLIPDDQLKRYLANSANTNEKPSDTSAISLNDSNDSAGVN